MPMMEVLEKTRSATDVQLHTKQIDDWPKSEPQLMIVLPECCHSRFNSRLINRCHNRSFKLGLTLEQGFGVAIRPCLRCDMLPHLRLKFSAHDAKFDLLWLFDS